MYLLADAASSGELANVIYQWLMVFFAALSVIGIIGSILYRMGFKKTGKALMDAEKVGAKHKEKAQEYAVIGEHIVKRIEELRARWREEKSDKVKVIQELIEFIKDSGMELSFKNGETMEDATRRFVKDATENGGIVV